MSKLRKGKPEGGAHGVPSAVDAAAAAKVPTLVAFLTQTVWDKDEVRKTGTVMVLAEEGKWKAWVHDRDCARSAWLSGSTLLELLQAVEDGLSQDSLGWRSTRPIPGKK